MVEIYQNKTWNIQSNRNIHSNIQYTTLPKLSGLNPAIPTFVNNEQPTLSFTGGNNVIGYGCYCYTCLQYIDGLEQDCSNSSVLAMELLQSCTKPLT